MTYIIFLLKNSWVYEMVYEHDKYVIKYFIIIYN